MVAGAVAQGPSQHGCLSCPFLLCTWLSMPTAFTRGRSWAGRAAMPVMRQEHPIYRGAAPPLCYCAAVRRRSTAAQCDRWRRCITVLRHGAAVQHRGAMPRRAAEGRDARQAARARSAQRRRSRAKPVLLPRRGPVRSVRCGSHEAKHGELGCGCLPALLPLNTL
jgi:hypothetical protein